MNFYESNGFQASSIKFGTDIGYQYIFFRSLSVEAFVGLRAITPYYGERYEEYLSAFNAEITLKYVF